MCIQIVNFPWWDEPIRIETHVETRPVYNAKGEVVDIEHVFTQEWETQFYFQHGRGSGKTALAKKLKKK